MTINQLPKLKQQLAETKHLLLRLEESKDNISQERYLKLVSPVVSEGIVFIGSYDGYLYALN